MNPIQPFLDNQGTIILDGGLATQLEAMGCDLNDDLWSARLLIDQPDLIRQVHADYLWAGADCIITASYQATIPGFISWGLNEDKAVDLIRFSIDLAVEARDKYWQSLSADQRAQRERPLVAASVGPYAAYKADGSEYSGDFDLDKEGLKAFHRRRFAILASSPADILACETIPNAAEVQALAELLTENNGRYAWFSFTCRDGHHLSDGTPVSDSAAYLSSFDQVAAVGINCTPPSYLPSLIGDLQQATTKPILVYPNSGETYDPASRSWLGESIPAEFGTYSREWRKLGAAGIGGCCRTTPEHIRQIRDRFPYAPRR